MVKVARGAIWSGGLKWKDLLSVKHTNHEEKPALRSKARNFFGDVVIERVRNLLGYLGSINSRAWCVFEGHSTKLCNCAIFTTDL